MPASPREPDPPGQGVVVQALEGEAYAEAIPALAALVLDAVAGGAGVNFMAGVTPEEAAAWWRARRPQVRDGTITAFVARSPADGTIVGSTLLIRSGNPNAPHRAEIGKVLVQSSARRRGIARALLAAAEATALAEGRWLLILDTVTGSAADRFYRATGWQELGTMPDHSYLPDGRLWPTTYFWKDLRRAASDAPSGAETAAART